MSLPKNVSLSFGKFDARVSVGGVVKRKRCATVAEAIDFVSKARSYQTEAAGQRRAVQKKLEVAKSQSRDVNSLKWGGVSALETAFAFRVASEMPNYGLEALVLNEFTHADVIARPLGDKKDMWVPIQLKTCSSPNTDGEYYFGALKGYNDMVVFMHCKSDDLFWMFEGSALNERHSSTMCIRIGGVNDKRSSLKELASAILSRQRTLTESQARGSIKNKNQLHEYNNICKWRDLLLSPSGRVFEWPSGQNMVYDCIVDGLRVQVKSVCVRGDRPRAQAGLYKSNGRNSDSRASTMAYELGDCDFYTFLMSKDGVFHIWEIPENALSKHDFFSTAASPGKQTFSVPWPPDSLHWTAPYYRIIR